MIISSATWPTLADTLKAANLTTSACTLVQAIAEKPDLPERLAKMALMFKGKEQKSDARQLAHVARVLAPYDFRVRVFTEWLVRHQAPLWHFGIVHDQPRNEAYARALRHFVKPGMTVFEIGAGTGILAMLAAQAGAKHVYTCERREDVAHAARAIIERNGFADRITVIAKDANAVQLGVDLPERTDVFVAEIVDNSLLGEGVLPLTELARARFLKPNAILLPRHVSAVGYLVSGRGQHEKYRMQSAMGFDLSAFNCFSPLEINAGKGGGEVEPLSAPVNFMGFDLNQDTPAQGSQQITLVADQSGVAEGLMRWLRLDFGDGIVFENRPPQMSGWDPHLHILPTPMPVVPGSKVSVEVSHNRDRLFLIPQL